MDPKQQQIFEKTLSPGISPEKLDAALAALNGENEQDKGSAGFISEKQARAHLGGISRTNLWRWTKNGLKSYRVGRRKLFKAIDLDTFVETQSGRKENV